ncbi:hypothetical protein FJY63_10805, partial [Candidatus Sumerlaeota bacterium]|nr:hypothetical protein [Candidatus Sumerlaeota bacterium]
IAGGSPVSSVEGKQETTGEPPALRRSSRKTMWGLAVFGWAPSGPAI